MTQLIGARYELLAEIGKGGMGTVYRGVDTQSGQTVAIKILKPDLTQADILARFQREGELLRELDHPNIVKLLDVVEENSQHYLIIEFVSGGDLNTHLSKGKLEIEQVLRLSIDLADALTRAHKLDVIHRDLKPANVLLTATGTLRLTDFGIAHEGSRERVTDPDVIVGTVDYLSPEALNGKTLDQRADIWAFGVMLFEMLSGQRPFSDESLNATMMRILSGTPPDLEGLRPDAPVALVDLVYRMLERDREARIRSVRQVGLELEDLLHGRQSPAVRRERFATPTPTVIGELPKHNLPASSTNFVGREEDLSALARILNSSNVRLVTIVAPGGMGKTRLSLECAAQQIRYFSDGAYFVELAPLSSAEHIIAAVADAIGIQFAAESEPRQQLLNACHYRTMLLVMDNFEHLLDGAEIVSDILQAAPRVKILVTSRERLNLSGETLFMLSGMDFPEWETPDDALNYGAVKLFMQSARQAKPDFELAADDLTYLARICRLVAGMPLGIVLTAAWMNMLSLQEIASEIEASLDFLETDMRDVPERQRSIRGVFDYSYKRLSDDEQAVFRKLSVFRGGFTREAGQVIAGASLKTLMGLINKSLLRRDPEGRYQIHELLRQFGEQELINHREEQVAQESHAIFFAHFLQNLWEDLKGRRQVGALGEIDPEFENIRVAWQWLVENQREGELGAAASSLWFYLEAVARNDEGIELFGQAVERLRAGKQAWVMGHLLGRLAWFQGSINLIDICQDTAREGIALLRGIDRAEELVMALNTIGRWSVSFAQYSVTKAVGEEAFRIAQESDNAWAIRQAMLIRGAGLLFTGNVVEGRKICEECRTLSLEAGDSWLVGHVCIALVLDARESHNIQKIERFSRQSLQMFETLHNRITIAAVCIWLGGSLAQQGHELEAKASLYRGIKLSYDLGVLRTILANILSSVEDYFLQVHKPFALELLAMLLNHPACDEAISGWAEKTIAILKAELSPEDYEAAWQRGSAWSLDHAVALVLEHLS